MADAPHEAARRPVGLFDSGVGGLGVYAAARAMWPREAFVYLADQAHAPYGPRPLPAVRARAFAAADFLRRAGAKLVVAACNTASAAALHALRDAWPGLPFVGMEPAVKPAAATSAARAIGVLATAATFQGELFASVVDRFAHGVRVLTAACPEIVEAVEAGDGDAPALAARLRAALAPMREAGVDRVVLGCTHFPFARAAIARAVGPGVELVDPAPAVARRIGQVLAQRGEAAADDGSAPRATLFFTTGDPARFDRVAARLLGADVRSAPADLGA